MEVAFNSQKELILDFNFLKFLCPKNKIISKLNKHNFKYNQLKMIK